MSLYKYVAPNLWENILKDRLIRFTQPSVFNDPFEMQPYFNYIEKEPEMRMKIKDFLESDSMEEIWDSALRVQYMKIPSPIKNRLTFEMYQEQIRQAIQADIANIQAALEYQISQLSNKNGQISPDVKEKFLYIDKLVGVLSLTEKRDNLLMWAHYAQNHQGFVIEFDETHEFFQNKLNEIPPLRFLLKPMMSSTLSNEQWDELERSAKQIALKEKKEQNQDSNESYVDRLLKVVYSSERPYHETLNDITPTNLLLLKSIDWEYEQEWRMLRFLYNPDKTISNEFGDIYLFSFPSSCIKSIILGCRNTMKKEITNIVSTDKQYSHLKIYEAVLDERYFRLNIIPIAN